MGNAIFADTECGPLVSPNEVQRVEQWVNQAVTAGAQVLCGGTKLGNTTYAPTVLLNPPAKAKVSTQEVFGPVVCVYGTNSLSHAIEQANSLPLAFQAAVFTQKLAVALQPGAFSSHMASNCISRRRLFCSTLAPWLENGWLVVR